MKNGVSKYVDVTLRHNRNNPGFLKVFASCSPVFQGFEGGYNFPTWRLELMDWVKRKAELTKSVTVHDVAHVIINETRQSIKL